jgi:autotransporter-associated beta strand protein
VHDGAGVLTLAANNTYTGATTVNAGTLLVNGSQPSSPVTVASGAILGGTGTTGPVTVNGSISPGVGGPGVLHTGNTTFNSGSTFAVELNGTTVGSGYDQLFAVGTVTLVGPLPTVSVGFPSATGNVFAIIQSTGAIGGGFSGMPEGFTFVSGGRTFRINYTTNAVTLTDVTPAGAATSTPAVTPTPPPPPGTCILGDINCDGIVDIRDYGLWRQHFGESAGAATSNGRTGAALIGDLNNDGIVDIRDYGIWRANFGHMAGAAPRGTPGPTLPGSVPAASESRALLQVADSELAVPVIPLVGELLGLGGLVGWRRRRPPSDWE